jgi:hypothetical protein
MMGHMANADDNPNLPPPEETSALPSLAQVLDQASRQRSHHRMVVTGRRLLGLGIIDELPEDFPNEKRAVAWALEYHIESVDAQGRRRIRLASRIEHDDGADPPSVEDVPDDIVDVWRALLDLVTEPPAKARLHHLLFQHGGPESFRQARSAAEAYLESATNEDRRLDAVDDLVAATRLARAIGDSTLTADALDRVANLAKRYLADADPPAGIVLRALRHLVGEPDCPDRVDALLALAAQSWPDAYRRNQALGMMLERCKDASCRAEVWRRRVAAYTEEADAATSTIMRAVALQKALLVAEKSGDADLRREASSRLQAIRHETMETMTFRASSHRYDEESERLVNKASEGKGWRDALFTFATFGPLSGNAEQNRILIEQRHRQHPLANLFPVDLRSPEGLPIYTGTSEQDRFDVDLAMSEAQLVGQWAPIMATALHTIPERHGLPTLKEIGDFVSEWPAVEGPVGPAIARSLLRYWTGDSEGSAYTIVPRIETLVRGLVLRTARGIYRLQDVHKPGQYAGLGHLLPILQEEYALSESVARFLSVLLRHPAGLNRRNLMLHGYLDEPDPGGTAILLHTALLIATIRPTPSDSVPPDG